jgi:hypothetical protein
MLAALAALVLGGCVARTAASIATAPVRVVSKGVDLATTSQSEADEKRGRALRHREERLGRLERRYSRHSQECRAGSAAACEAAREEYAEIRALQRY